MEKAAEVARIMEEISRSPLASTSATKVQTMEFYAAIVDELVMRAFAIKEELELEELEETN